MQLALPSPMPDASPAVFAVNGRKPRQGVRGPNPGLHQRFAACKSTTALGVSWGLWAGTVPGARVSYEYDAFGNSFTVSGTTPNEFMYRGEQYDSDLGLYYLRARYYNPLTGRFMSRDPEDGKLTDPKSLHKYLYANGDPVNRIDPLGREGYEEEGLTYLGSLGLYKAIRVFLGAEAYGICGGTLWELWAYENPGASIDVEWAAFQLCVAVLQGQAALP
jgi:RHS repeat-associated protein